MKMTLAKQFAEVCAYFDLGQMSAEDRKPIVELDSRLRAADAVIEAAERMDQTWLECFDGCRCDLCNTKLALAAWREVNK